MSVVLRSRRGPIGVGWHAVALRRAMEQILGVGRASGGRADARAGRVAWIDVGAGAARGAVYGTDGQPHRPQVDLPVLSAADREAFVTVAQTHPELPALLAAGEYPQGIERELAPMEVSLLPRGPSELSHDCSCLDWPGPCRHVAALAYVLVEAVDEKPLHLLTLRGLRLEDLVKPVRATTGAQLVQSDEPGSADAPEDGADTADDGAARQDAPSPGFDPERADPGVLVPVVGEHTAAVVAAFFREPSATPKRQSHDLQ